MWIICEHFGSSCTFVSFCEICLALTQKHHPDYCHWGCGRRTPRIIALLICGRITPRIIALLTGFAGIVPKVQVQTSFLGLVLLGILGNVRGLA